MEDRSLDNTDKYITLVKALDPELFDIKVAIEETQVNPFIIPKLIRVISNIYYGTGYGKVVIQISDREVVSIDANEKELINLPAVLLRDKK